MLIDLWYKYNADYYSRLYPKPMYPYCKLLQCTISLANTTSFYGDPKYKNNQVNLFKKAYRSKYLFKLKLDLDFDLDQLLKWEKRIVTLIENREVARSPRQYYVGTKKRLERIKFDLTVLPDII